MKRNNSTMISYKSVINRVNKYVSVVDGLTDINFLMDIKVPKKVKTLEEIEQKKNNYLENEEIKILLNAIHVLTLNTRILALNVII
ncbi:hypothetical protein [Macrococcoides bohemicum]|uniref:hypothetical protein n=1 Tax=Macrococcoides bohemicum TaxID=1903056 RepID=UPI00165E64FC|nr:hypothetical protein [Macrococcus bohemicus]